MPSRPEPEPEIAALMAEVARDIAERLRNARLETALTQDDVAAPFNRSGQWVSDLESGKVTPRADLLVALGHVIGDDPGRLLRGEFEGESPFLARMRAIEPDLERRVGGTDMAIAIVEAFAREFRRSDSRYETRREARADRTVQAESLAAELPEGGEDIPIAGEQEPGTERGAINT